MAQKCQTIQFFEFLCQHSLDEAKGSRLSKLKPKTFHKTYLGTKPDEDQRPNWDIPLNTCRI